MRPSFETIYAELIRLRRKGGLEVESINRHGPNLLLLPVVIDEFRSGSYASDSKPIAARKAVRCTIALLQTPIDQVLNEHLLLRVNRSLSMEDRMRYALATLEYRELPSNKLQEHAKKATEVLAARLIELDYSPCLNGELLNSIQERNKKLEEAEGIIAAIRRENILRGIGGGLPAVINEHAARDIVSLYARATARIIDSDALDADVVSNVLIAKIIALAALLSVRQQGGDREIELLSFELSPRLALKEAVAVESILGGRFSEPWLTGRYPSDQSPRPTGVGIEELLLLRDRAYDVLRTAALWEEDQGWPILSPPPGRGAFNLGVPITY